MGFLGSVEVDARRLRRYVIVLLCGWTLIVGASVLWNLHEIRRESLEAARITARVAHFKDVVYRRWNAQQGGLYVPVTQEIRPNPYLKAPERDVETLTGKKLTLVNPAYMTRMAHEIQETAAGVLGHITSLKPTRPGNAPDPWETEALKAFERGETEVSSVELIQGKRYMRLIRPLVTEKGCLWCHKAQGYKEGEIRGGISVAVPIKRWWSLASSHVTALIGGHTGLWMLGIFGILIGARRLDRSISDTKRLSEQLIHSQKMEAVGTLAGGVAHDFNNLLTIINGYTELILAEKTEDDPLYEDIKKVHETGRKGADLVKSLLSFSRRAEITLRPSNLNDIVNSSVALLSRTIPKIVEIKTIFERDLAPINADAGQIEQVLLNLCLNAKDAMPEGGRINIRTKNVIVDEPYCKLHVGAKPGLHTLIEVVDTGMGMDKKIVDRIFDPFFTTKGWDSNKGTGLGLSMVKGIVEQHGGWITCESTPGEGSTFRLYFPALGKKSKADPTVTDTAQAPKDGDILLVDDEEQVAILGKRILERAGYRVIIESDGKTALETYEKDQSSIALVILDLIMPQMDGEKCLDELLKLNPNVKVIFSTGKSLRRKEKDRLAGYVQGFVDKPYHVERLLKAVEKVLGAAPQKGH